MNRLVSLIKKLNEFIAIKTVTAVSTMACVYAFLAISILPLGFPKLEIVCMYISSTVLQLVLLPLIMVGQSLLGRDQEIRAKQDHEALIEMLKDIHALLKSEDEVIKDSRDIAAQLTAIESRI